MALVPLPEINELTSLIIKAAIAVHRFLGPGLLESVYLKCLIFELKEMGLGVESQQALPVIYKGTRIDCGFRVDLIVDGTVIVEAKSVEEIARVHCAAPNIPETDGIARRAADQLQRAGPQGRSAEGPE